MGEMRDATGQGTREGTPLPVAGATRGWTSLDDSCLDLDECRGECQGLDLDE